ncbi:chromosome partition Smc domain protein [Mycobacterium xenopi 4042]|uniref:Chromosome partition Smc domain protein n=1 Tax=Mycobacterium xenopi 4042 TaxID=1299334 RepID=X8E8C1_MYCXE|nr:chromosome partition Smc domain protein [Mycobacterium xenopi 4042]
MGQRRFGPQALDAGAHLRNREGRAELAAAETQANELGAALAGALTEQAARQDAAEQALAALNESDAAISAIYEQLGRLGQDARTAEEEWVRLLRQREELETGRAQTVEELTELESRLRTAQQTQALSAGDPVDRQQIAAERSRLETARADEVEARLAVRTAEERANAVRGRADSLRRAAAAEREARLRAQQARAAREHAAAVAAAVADSGRLLAGRLSQVVTAASRRRDSLAVERQQHSAAMAAVREEVDALRTRIAALTEALHRDEVAKAEAALRIEGLEQMVLEQFGMAPDDLVAEYGPQVPLPPTELELVEYEQAGNAASRSPHRHRCRSTGPPRNAGPSAPNESWPSWAGSTRWRWRSTPRWRSATTFCPLSSKTSRPRARTCSTSSPTSTPASCRCLPRRSPTWNASFARCSPRCSPAGKAGCG